MFSGIVQATARVRNRSSRGEAVLWTIEKPRGWRVRPGDSIAVDGACLTVKSVGRSEWLTELMPETLRKTYFLKRLPAEVNLEPALKLSDALAGHLVLGHVDCPGRIIRILPEGASRVYRFSFPARFSRLVADKASVTVDGVSLTVARKGAGWLETALVGYTLAHTTLGGKSAGAWVNLEFDVLAKYLAALHK